MARFRRGEVFPASVKKMKIKNICQQCGRGFEIPFKRRNQKYCGRKCMGLSNSGENNSAVIHGVHSRPGWRLAQSQCHKGIKQSPESILKRAESNRGKKRTEEFGKRISAIRKHKFQTQGFLNSPATREKISMAQKGRPCPKATIQYLKAQTGEKNYFFGRHFDCSYLPPQLRRAAIENPSIFKNYIKAKIYQSKIRRSLDV
jgi:hypothetical protein